MLRIGYNDYYLYSDSDDYSVVGDDGDDSSLEDCRYCDATYKRRNRQRHLDNVHKCSHCPNYMPKSSIEAHIENKHMVGFSHCNQRMLRSNLQQHESTHFVRCQYCNENVLKQILNTHVANRHPFHATVGMIRKISDSEFNRLVAENRVYAKDGHLFVK